MGIKKRYANDLYVDRLAASRSDISEHPYFATPVGASGGSPLLLDQYPGAVFAWSLRRLRSDYAGACLRVRRSSDSAEQDIGFTASGDLDEAALTTFCGASSGYVTTFYGQDATGRNATQTTALHQPRIFAGGVIPKINGKPYLFFDGGGDSLSSSPNVVTGTDALSVFFIGDAAPSTGQGCLLIEGSVGGADAIVLTNEIGVRTGGGGITFGSETGSQNQISWMYPGNGSISDFRAYLNGTESSQTSITDNTINLGATTTTTLFDGIAGNLQELVAYKSDRSAVRSKTESDQNDYWSVY